MFRRAPSCQTSGRGECGSERVPLRRPGTGVGRRLARRVSDRAFNRWIARLLGGGFRLPGGGGPVRAGLVR